MGTHLPDQAKPLNDLLVQMDELRLGERVDVNFHRYLSQQVRHLFCRPSVSSVVKVLSAPEKVTDGLSHDGAADLGNRFR
jgi:hypothetical protein